jgi:hypothetical protein
MTAVSITSPPNGDILSTILASCPATTSDLTKNHRVLAIHPVGDFAVQTIKVNTLLQAESSKNAGENPVAPAWKEEACFPWENSISNQPGSEDSATRGRTPPTPAKRRLASCLSFRQSPRAKSRILERRTPDKAFNYDHHSLAIPNCLFQLNTQGIPRLPGLTSKFRDNKIAALPLTHIADAPSDCGIHSRIF